LALVGEGNHPDLLHLDLYFPAVDHIHLLLAKGDSVVPNHPVVQVESYAFHVDHYRLGLALDVAHKVLVEGTLHGRLEDDLDRRTRVGADHPAKRIDA